MLSEASDVRGAPTKRTTHLLSGAAVGALLSFLTGEDLFALVAVGSVAGIAPDFDLLLAPMARGIHRSAASHSLLAAVVLSSSWAAVLVLLMSEADAPMLDGGFVLASSLVVFLSVFLHAAEDSLTIAGCTLLYPVSRRRWKGPVRYDDFLVNTAISASAVLVALVCAGDL